MEKLINFKDYSKKFKKKVIGPFNFSIEKNKITALLGSSGSGKTVILNSLLGIIKKFNGSIDIENFNRKTRKYFIINSKIGYYTQMDFSLYTVSAYDFLLDICIMMGINKKESFKRIEHWMKYFDIWEDKDKKINNYSWGMKNRINLILCFIKEPEIIIMDEPGANLDSYWRKKIKDLLIKYKKEGRTIIITVHNIDEINEVIDNYLIIDSGKLIFSGSKEELDLYNKYKVYLNEKFDIIEFKKFLDSKNIKSFKYDEEEISIVFATKDLKEINWIFIYFISKSIPILNLIKLPINMEAVHKALDSKIIT
ncbi:ABC transporter ATP-binding protein [Spiroplasma cantharicola]|uniref:ABC transporter ATP-binding protein n=1 Tax=Spiroplasma cantharicola TaxID=362837 RepID=A0A0M4JRY6_9MOLU|nr:ABC transporter ATP-binding protein [Spiroplasma cantharicola]ALD66033.1 ABC transporter ATP-binding protein [Spiroplasma cantharicola]